MPDFKQLDFGPIGHKLNHTRPLTIANLNPMVMFIDKIRMEHPTCDGDETQVKIRLIPLNSYDIMTNQRKRDYTNENKIFSRDYDPDEIDNFDYNGPSIVEVSDLTLPPNTLINFLVEIIEPNLLVNNCTFHEGRIYFKGYHIPDFEFPISFIVVNAPLSFENVVIDFPPAFPDTKQSQDINLQNNLNYSLYIENEKSLNPSKISIEILQNVLTPNEKANIIKISTVPFNNFNTYLRLLSQNLFHKNILDSKDAMNYFQTEQVLTYFDILAYQSELKEWEQRVKMNQTDSISVVKFQTNIVQNVTLKIRSVVEQPTLLQNSTYNFGLLEVDTSKRGSITVVNPSKDPITVSFYLAPANYLEMLFKDLMSDESLVKWMVLCNNITFFNPYGKKICQDFLKLNKLGEKRKKEVIDFFFHNYFSLISNNDIGIFIRKFNFR